MPSGQFPTFFEKEPSSFKTECCFKAPTPVRSATPFFSFGLEFGVIQNKQKDPFLLGGVSVLGYALHLQRKFLHMFHLIHQNLYYRGRME